MAIIDTTKHDDSDAESISSSTVLVNEQQLTASVTSVASTTSFVVVDGEPTTAEVAPHTSSEEASQQQQAPLTIPLDAAPVKRVTVDGVLGDNSGVAGSRGLMRRDSLKRRESLLKGKEGSRRRQRWENDHFTHNPHYTAPEPRDFAPEPVHPKRIVRYEFASLWDPSNPKMFGYNSTTTHSSSSSGGNKQKSIGTVTKNLRDRVKRSEWAVGLLRDLEEEVRRYAAGLFGCSASAVSRCSSVTPDSNENKEKEKRRQKRGGKRKLKTRHGGNGRSSRSSSISSSTSSLVVVSDTEGGVGLLGNEEGGEQEVEVAVVEDSVKDSEDEEIVFVPKMARMSLEDTAAEQPPEKDGAIMTEEEVEQVQLEKPMFEAPASDPSASFVRWLIHSIALYYGLRSWSVDVGSNPQMRVAFVGVNPSISSSRKALAKMSKNEHLPRPLWRML